jgi:hypothetical protein
MNVHLALYFEATSVGTGGAGSGGGARKNDDRTNIPMTA